LITPLQGMEIFQSLKTAFAERLRDSACDTVFDAMTDGEDAAISWIEKNATYLQVEARDKENHDATPLIVAAHHNFARLTKTLINLHADVYAKDKQGLNALQTAARFGHNDVIKVLARWYSSDDFHDALCNAAECGQTHTVKLLTDDYKVDINCCALSKKEKQTPLFYAVHELRKETVDFLLERRAHIATAVAHPFHQAWRPLLLAVINKPAKPQEHFETAIIMMHRGINPNIVINDKGDTPLHCAALALRKDLVELLLIAGAKHTVRNNAGETPLQTANTDDPALKALLTDPEKCLEESGDTSAYRRLMLEKAHAKIKAQNTKNLFVRLATSQGLPKHKLRQAASEIAQQVEPWPVRQEASVAQQPEETKKKTIKLTDTVKGTL